MSGWKYISIVVLMLLGGAIYFGYWTVGQYNVALDVQDVAYSQFSASLSAYTKAILDKSKTATTTDVSEVSTTTEPVVIWEAATTTPDIFLTFPAAGSDIYIGCSYKIVWQPSVIIRSLGVALIDAGNLKAMGPIASGISATSSTTGFESFTWKVGNVWPGEYFILISKINDVESETKSKYFMVHKMPEDISASKRGTVCEESGGSF